MRGFGRGSLGRQSSSLGRTGQEQIRGRSKRLPHCTGGGGGHNFVDLRIVLSPCIRPSASVDFEARLFDIVCLVVCLFGCLFVWLFVCCLFVSFACLCCGRWIVLRLETTRSHFCSSPRRCSLLALIHSLSAAGAAQLRHAVGARCRSWRRPVGQLRRPAGAGAGGGGAAMAICGGGGFSKRRFNPVGGRFVAECLRSVCFATGGSGGGGGGSRRQEAHL